MREILHSDWIEIIQKDQKKLITVAVELYEMHQDSAAPFSDYSFVVFPMAKAYEGFLKQRLFEFGLINKQTYEGKRLRIGRALNPDVHENSRDEFWLYDDLSLLCGSDIARELWDTWLLCRNRVFHYYPTQPNLLNLEQAGSYLEKISSAMSTLTHCHISVTENQQEQNAPREQIYSN